jgi:enamine deaminase RidA (YjgF/YER057c/UK114 family)
MATTSSLTAPEARTPTNPSTPVGRGHPRESIWPGLASGVPKPLMPYSPAIRAGDWLFVAGTIASDFKTGLAPEVKGAPTFRDDALGVQGRYVLRNLFNTIRAAGASPERDMVRMWQWLVSERPTPDDLERGDLGTGVGLAPYLHVRRDVLPERIPASSEAGVRELLCLGTRIEVEMICRVDGTQTEWLGEPVEPHGHAPAVRRGDWVFLSAQHGVGPSDDSDSDWSAARVEAQTDAALAKLEGLASLAGSSLARTVKAEVHIGHPRDFAAMDRVWRRWFPANPPARVVVPNLGLGVRGARVQVALTLLTDASTIAVQTVATSDAPEPFGHEPQATRAGDVLFLSTQMAFGSDGMLPAGMVRHPEFPWYGSPGQAQMRYMMKNVAAICEAAGTTVDQICRRVCFHSDFQWFAESIEEWARWFPGDKPASTTLRLGGPLVVPGANTLLDLTAYVPGGAA